MLYDASFQSFKSLLDESYDTQFSNTNNLLAAITAITVTFYSIKVNIGAYQSFVLHYNFTVLTKGIGAC